MHDPGWNDPPLMNYDSTSQATVKKGILHKPKRVAFPLGTPPPSSSISNCPPSSTPPPFHPGAISAPTPPLLQKPSTTTPRNDLSSKDTSSLTVIGSVTSELPLPLDKEQSLTKVMQIFDDVIKSLDDIDKEEAEIRKRLAVMKKMWEDLKLDAKVQQQLLQLAKALEDGDHATASAIQVRLGVDSTSQCSAWMAGIRKLVHLIAAQNTAPSNIDQNKRAENINGLIAMMDNTSISNEVGDQVDVSNLSDVGKVNDSEAEVDRT